MQYNNLLFVFDSGSVNWNQSRGIMSSKQREESWRVFLASTEERSELLLWCCLFGLGFEYYVESVKKQTIATSFSIAYFTHKSNKIKLT